MNISVQINTWQEADNEHDPLASGNLSSGFGITFMTPDYSISKWLLLVVLCLFHFLSLLFWLSNNCKPGELVDVKITSFNQSSLFGIHYANKVQAA